MYESDLKDISGLLKKKEGEWVIYVNQEDSPSRKVFTIAHELGHYFLHKDSCDNFVDGPLIYRKEKSKFETKEIEANEFAGQLQHATKDNR